MNRRTKLVTGLVAAVGLALSGCGTTNGDGPSGGGEEAPSGPVVYWSQWEETEPQADILKEASEAFTAETGIEVELVFQGRQVMQKVQPLLRSGDVPDMVESDTNTMTATLVRTGHAHDLTGVFGTQVPGEEENVGDVLGDYDALISDPAMEGPFMLPQVLTTWSIFYDGSAHPDLADVELDGWDDLVSLLDDLKDERGSGPIAVDGDIGGYLAIWTTSAIIAEFGEGGLAELASDETGEAWRSDEVREVLEEVEQLSDYWAEGSFGSKFPQLQEKWAAGESDLLFMGSWAPVETSTSTGDDFEYRQIAYPSGSAGDFLQANMMGVAILGEAENVAGAEQFMAWLARSEVMGAFAQDADSLVARADVEQPEVLADTAEIMANSTVIKHYDGIGGDLPGYVPEVFQPINLDLVTDRITVDEAIERLVSEQADYWARQG